LKDHFNKKRLNHLSTIEPLAEAVGLEPTRGVNPTDFRDRLLSQLGYASVVVFDYITVCKSVNTLPKGDRPFFRREDPVGFVKKKLPVEFA
jgi:hypothetical protein